MFSREPHAIFQSHLPVSLSLCQGGKQFSISLSKCVITIEETETSLAACRPASW